MEQIPQAPATVKKLRRSSIEADLSRNFELPMTYKEAGRNSALEMTAPLVAGG